MDDTSPPTDSGPSDPPRPSGRWAFLWTLEEEERRREEERAAQEEAWRRDAPRRLAEARRRVELMRVLAVLSDLRDRRFARGRSCPRCGSRRVIRWGRFSGRQRYRCKGCRCTFSDLTGTPAAYSKRLLLWPAYAACLLDGCSVRAAAARVGIHKDTAFRWRHRILAARAGVAPRLEGPIELSETTFPYSDKGRRSGWPGWSTRSEWWRHHRPRVRVLVLADRGDGRWAGIVGNRASRFLRWDEDWRRVRPRFGHGADALELALDNVTGDAVLIGRRGAASHEAAVARRRGIPYRQRTARNSDIPLPLRLGRLGHRDGAPRVASADPLHHVEHVDAYVHRLRRWMVRFHGVATRYLVHYLCWFEMVDARRRDALELGFLRWELPGPP